MATHDLWIVDSFTERPFHGNPAGVHWSEQLPSPTRMQNIASELNLSETAFISPDHEHTTAPRNSLFASSEEANRYLIRYYSPKKEIPLCGHATLAASQVLFEQSRVEQSETQQLNFQTASGLKLRVQRKGQGIEMQFPVYSLAAAIAPPAMLDALGISAVLYSGFNVETQILLIEIASADQLRNLTPDYSALLESCDFINGSPLHGVSITARADDEFDFHSRFFWPWSGGNEDPVTGGTHTFLAKYWAEKLNKSVLKSFQSSPRTGRMEVELKSMDSLLIRGQAVVFLEGNLRKDPNQ